MSRGQELLLNLSGPAVNLLLGSIMLTGKTMQSMRAAAVHWAVAAATLLPLGNSDGTVIADILLECCCGKLTGRTRRWLRRGIGVAALAGLWYWAGLLVEEARQMWYDRAYQTIIGGPYDSI